MSVFPFLMTLRNELEKPLATLPLEQRQNGEVAPPQVYIGQLPPRSRPEMGAFVLLQPLSGRQDEDSFHLVEVAIRVCVYNSGLEACENDLFNLLELIRRELAPFRQQSMAGKYVLTTGDGGLLPWTRPDDQAQPYLEAYIISTWKLWGYE